MSDLLNPTSGRRILAGNLSNYYAGIATLEQCVDALSDLGDFAQREGDMELAYECDRVNGELQDGGDPSLQFPDYEIDDVAPPERKELWTDEEAEDGDADVIAAVPDFEDGPAPAEPEVDGEAVAKAEGELGAHDKPEPEAPEKDKKK